MDTGKVAVNELPAFVRQLAPLVRRGVAEDTTILRGHLVCERLLWDIVRAESDSAASLAELRLSFAQLLRVAQSFTTLSASPELCEQMDLLNRIRNAWAHELEPKRITDMIERLIAIAIRKHHQPKNFKRQPRAKRLAEAVITVVAELGSLAHVVTTVHAYVAEEGASDAASGAKSRIRQKG